MDLKELANLAENKLDFKSDYFASFLPMNNIPKEKRVGLCADGYKFFALPNFEKIADLLKKDCAYSPFPFTNGKRGSDTVKPITKWLPLDIDHSEFTDEETHDMLKALNIKHIIARTSNKDESKRFRLILDLDELTDFSEINYKKFAKLISQDLNLNADYLSPAQVYFAYAHSKPICYFEGKQINAKQYVELAGKEEEKQIEPINNEKAKELRQKYPNQVLFKKAFAAKPGDRSTKTYAALRYAVQLGFTQQEVIELFEEINRSWLVPFDEISYKNFIKQIQKDYQKWATSSF